MRDILAMVADLVVFQWRVFFESTLRSIILFGSLLPRWRAEKREQTWKEGLDYFMYEGVVWHERQRPVRHQFEMKVRYMLINLNKLPLWFAGSAIHHMTAQQARSLVGTTGPVYLLCMPKSVGYEQNPISVYYCYDDTGSSLVKTIAEVTNTPWGERVTFVFDPTKDTVAKALHVSPFMDMQGSWHMHTPAPGEKLSLTIKVEHPELGHFFVATLQAKRVDPGQNPELFMWLMPQKVAIWIYWQALVLFWKGVKFVGHPKYVDGNLYRKRAQVRDTALRTQKSKEAESMVVKVEEEVISKPVACPRFCTWEEADRYPWL